MPTTFHKLGIGLTALCAIACVSLCAMWFRSYEWRDNLELELPGARGCNVESAVGQFAVRIYPIDNLWSPAQGWFQIPVSGDPCWPANRRSGFDCYLGEGYAGVVVPHWLLLLLTATVAVRLRVRGPVRFRFGVRTLLLVTTLMGALLGVIVWAVR